MPEKKNFRLNCEVCDARNMREGMFDDYDNIRINAEILIVNEDCRKIMDRYPIHLNVEDVIETEGEVAIQIQNGVMEINAGQGLEKDAILCVNGALTIAPGTEDILKRYISIIVNGTVKYPKSLMPCLSKMKVNGTACAYPDDYILLKRNAVLDAYFPLRAREGAGYYAERRVILVDENVDVPMLVEKRIHFETQELLVAESMVEDAILLIGEDTKLMVVPDGCVFLNGSVTLDEALVHKYGTKLYINGELTLNEESTSYIPQIEYLYVNGDVGLLPEQKEAFLALNAEYDKLKIRKGKLIKNKLKVFVDAAMLASAPMGIRIGNCVEVTLDAEITAEQIQECLQLENCVEVICTKEQKGAVQLVGENLTDIVTEKEEKIKEEENVKCVQVNAETYVL